MATYYSSPRFFFLVLSILISLLSDLSSGQEDVGCFQHGACLEQDNVGLALRDSPRGCLEYCQSLDNCYYFTHYDVDSFCEALANCTVFEIDICNGAY